MSLREGIARSGPGGGDPKHPEVKKALLRTRAALTFPARYLLWVLHESQPQGRPARITYHAGDRVNARRAA